MMRLMLFAALALSACVEERPDCLDLVMKGEEGVAMAGMRKSAALIDGDKQSIADADESVRQAEATLKTSINQCDNEQVSETGEVRVR